MRIPITAALVVLALSPAPAGAARPAGWLLSGTEPSAYEMQRDTVVTHAGKPSGRMTSTLTAKGFGTMMQCLDPAEYAGKRIRFSGWVRCRDVRRWAGLWMRVDAAGSPPPTLAFDNMQDRPIQGTRDWTRYEVVLDVAKEAKAICFGVLLDGPGTLWLSDVAFEPVVTSVPTTNRNMTMNRTPANLDFAH
jgi:hypothetical protein